MKYKKNDIGSIFTNLKVENISGKKFLILLMWCKGNSDKINSGIRWYSGKICSTTLSCNNIYFHNESLLSSDSKFYIHWAQYSYIEIAEVKYLLIIQFSLMTGIPFKPKDRFVECLTSVKFCYWNKFKVKWIHPHLVYAKSRSVALWK